MKVNNCDETYVCIYTSTGHIQICACGLSHVIMSILQDTYNFVLVNQELQIL